MEVAPLAGAWIETDAPEKGRLNIKVAPLAGAWIETVEDLGKTFGMEVAPLAGAWIETLDELAGGNYFLSHPSRVRGLKP